MASQKVGWEFDEGDEIVPGRRAVHLLGGGIRAEAWVAWDERLHALVVAKVLRPSHTSDESALAALAREARVLAELQHPAIVRCFGAVLDGPRPHIVLESLDGPRLSTLIRRFGPLAPEQLVPLGIEVAQALAFMHDSGYVHLDVKPRNLVIAATPRLIDLGIARSFEEVRSLSAPVGTLAYMAPEQSLAETTASSGPPADVWALGAVLYVAASGSHPYASVDSPAGPPQATRDPQPLDRRVPPALAELIIRCLARDPGARSTASELGQLLEPMLEESRRVARRRLRARTR